MREQILFAARAEDYDALAELATRGDSTFTYSFGESGGDPGEYWRKQEEQGESPAQEIARVLELPSAQAEGIYVWPYAHGLQPPYNEADRARLLEHFSEEQIEDWEAFGGYTGYRAGIAPDGDWMYFVAGD